MVAFGIASAMLTTYDSHYQNYLEDALILGGPAADTYQTYDEMGRLESTRSVNHLDLPQHHQTDEWRTDGLLLKRDGVVPATAEETFLYDDHGRVMDATSGSRSLTYKYDAFGNLEEKLSTIGTDTDVDEYKYLPGGSPHRLTAVDIGGVTHNLTYKDRSWGRRRQRQLAVPRPTTRELCFFRLLTWPGTYEGGSV